MSSEVCKVKPVNGVLAVGLTKLPASSKLSPVLAGPVHPAANVMVIDCPDVTSVLLLHAAPAPVKPGAFPASIPVAGVKKDVVAGTVIPAGYVTVIVPPAGMVPVVEYVPHSQVETAPAWLGRSYVATAATELAAATVSNPMTEATEASNAMLKKEATTLEKILWVIEHPLAM